MLFTVTPLPHLLNLLAEEAPLFLALLEVVMRISSKLRLKTPIRTKTKQL